MIATAVHSPIFEAVQRAITDLSGGFNPRNLFAANEPGYLYDLDDLSTVFLDSAGTTPASVNGLVGLVLDKSKGLALGAEKITNGDFSSSANWTPDAAWSIAGGVATKAAVASGNIAQALTLTANTFYQVTYTINSISGSSVFVRLLGGSVIDGIQRSVPGTYTELIIAPASMTAFAIRGASTTVAEIDNISVKELPGNHAYQGTTGSKPILRGTPTGANLASGASWTAGTGWSVAGDTATATTSSGTLTAAAVAAVVGKFYRVTYTITRTAGSIQPTFGGRTGTSRSESGTYVQYFDNATSTAALVFTGTGFTGTVTLNTIEAMDVSAGSVAAPYALQYDGVDDFLQTAAVDFSATDKVTVCHGVRKLSDAAAGYLMNTNTTLAVAGTQYIAAPAKSSGPFRYYARGATDPGTTASTTNLPGPNLTVLTCQADIAGDSRTMRVNGTANGSSADDLGTGNFGNYAFYFGRLYGTTGPYNGLMYSSVCIGRLLTAAELANVERWVARKTGLTL